MRAAHCSAQKPTARTGRERCPARGDLASESLPRCCAPEGAQGDFLFVKPVLTEMIARSGLSCDLGPAEGAPRPTGPDRSSPCAPSPRAPGRSDAGPGGALPRVPGEGWGLESRKTAWGRRADAEGRGEGAGGAARLPCRRAQHRPSAVLQSRAVPSSLPVSRRCPSGLRLSQLIPPRCSAQTLRADPPPPILPSGGGGRGGSRVC